jgi:hypothetical protein
MADKYKNSAKYKRIKNNLIEQLKAGGNDSPVYLDMVEVYMCLWCNVQKLQDDIDRRGVSIEYNNGGGQCGIKKNESIGEMNKTNAQMLKILDGLKIRPSTGYAEDETL